MRDNSENGQLYLDTEAQIVIIHTPTRLPYINREAEHVFIIIYHLTLLQ
jgi:hypothetical protein